MAWDYRANYRYFRKYGGTKDGKEITIFYGRGPEAMAEAARYEIRKQNILEFREMKRRDKLLDLQIEALNAKIHMEIAAVLEPQGYHRVRRQWVIKGQGRRNPPKVDNL